MENQNALFRESDDKLREQDDKLQKQTDKLQKQTDKLQHLAEKLSSQNAELQEQIFELREENRNLRQTDSDIKNAIRRGSDGIEPLQRNNLKKIIHLEINNFLMSMTLVFGKSKENAKNFVYQ